MGAAGNRDVTGPGSSGQGHAGPVMLEIIAEVPDIG